MYFRASSATQANAFAKNVMNNVIKAKSGAGDNMLDPAMARYLGVGGVPAYQNSPTMAGGMTGMTGMTGMNGMTGMSQNANFGNQANSSTVVNNYYLGNRYNGVGASNTTGSQMQQTEMAYVSRLLASVSQLLRYFSFAR
jgi:hypothetical protein